MGEKCKIGWEPWHEVVKLSDDLKKGELSLSQFAADLYDVAMGEGTDLYRDRNKFFAFTYPTYSMRDLAKDVANRLAGKNDKAVRQLELTYGGGKTHTLITLYHLFNDPDGLPDLPAVRDFRATMGMKPPETRVAVLAFDKIDLLIGIKTRSPSGKVRILKNPWSILAYQLGGDDALKVLNDSSSIEERDAYPAEPVLKEVLAMPAKEGKATLILLDEALMYARVKVAQDPAWRDNLINFFQCLTQAATKLPNCALIASLLATDPRKYDQLGKELIHDMSNVFRREKEEGVQPVSREDVAEILRRRFFQPDSISHSSPFRVQVVEALKGINELDETTKKEGATAETRYFSNYPFHPDLTDVFYTKWTSLDGFQKTRGILRTFALALRDASKWDTSPLIDVGIFLSNPSKQGLSEAARELAGVAANEEFEGPRQEWAKIVEGELDKAKAIQAELPGLKHREMEKAVFTTFLHSQPIGRKARSHDIMVMLGTTRPMKLDVRKGLIAWTQTSWFLDEEGGSVKGELPENWRLGTRPNLKHMHDDALGRVVPELVEQKLIDETSKQMRSLGSLSSMGIKVYTMPDRPADVADAGNLQLAILGPRFYSEVGKPNKDAVRFLTETTSEERPRINRNAIILVAPAKDLLQKARDSIRAYLAWEDVKTQLQVKGEGKESRLSTLMAYLNDTKNAVPQIIAQAYCVVITLSEKGEPIAFKVDVSSGSLFDAIRQQKMSRISGSKVSSSALLPDGPYDLWQKGDRSRRVSDIVGMFAQFPHLPKMMGQKEILDTLVEGAKQGEFVLRLTRPDRSQRTFWRETPNEADMKEPSMEVVLLQFAELSTIKSSLVAPGGLPGLWSKDEMSVAEVKEFFDGTKKTKVSLGNYEEVILVPMAAAKVVEAAIHQAVENGAIWLLTGPVSLLAQTVPPGVISDDAHLRAPPEVIRPLDILPTVIPDAWQDGQTTAYTIGLYLSKKQKLTMPWKTVSNVIESAREVRVIEIVSGPWPCDDSQAKSVVLKAIIARQPGESVTKALSGEADLNLSNVQDLAEAMTDIVEKYPDLELKLHLRVELTKVKNKDDVAKVNELLKKVREDLQLR
jgi:hypothetical protein